MFNMCIPSLWYWKLIFQWAKTTMKSISFETYIYIYIYVTYITLHYITYGWGEQQCMCVHGVCHICALRSCVFFPSIFFTFKTKKAHLGFPCEVLVKQIQIPEPTLRHLAISAQLPFAPTTDLENFRNRRQIWPKLPKQWHQPLVHTRSGRLHAAPGFNLCYK